MPVSKANLERRDNGAGAPAGFTLLELLVVLTILAAVMMLAPSLMAGSGARVRAAGQDLATDLRNLRDDAIRERRVADCIVDPSSGAYTLGTGEPPQTLPSDVSLSLTPGVPPLVDDPVQHIAFYPDGSSSGGTITLASGAMRISVQVDWLNGRVILHE